jgi:hypothetical protein
MIDRCSQAEADERRRRNDDLKLKIALERSVNETSPDAVNGQVRHVDIFFVCMCVYLPLTMPYRF